MAGQISENRALLEQVVRERIKLDPKKDELYKNVLMGVVKAIKKTAEVKCPEFKEVYYSRYHGGSYFDNLQVKSSIDFDLNIIFRMPPPETKWKLAEGDDGRKPDFFYMRSTPMEVTSKTWKGLADENRRGESVILPKKMHTLLDAAVTKALTAMDHKVEVKGTIYKVTRSIKTPVVLNIEGKDVDFTVDLVPAFELQMKNINIDPDLKERVEHVMANAKTTCSKFMAIVLSRADSDLFQLDFHDVERALIDSRGGCIYDVIKLIKYIRNYKQGNLTKLKSHWIKVFKIHGRYDALKNVDDEYLHFFNCLLLFRRL